ncbi:Pyruvate/Phosphoenolpyruvate kinase-like domain-containing protein [Truncatella angustata]|uniref:Pyruvate/Phosphoenolpyruvate kinase-like domain-containing protein n=1 Tax=Truncatella angustata TaxID=152316 RepID=A0A9P8RND7_9PEZI|nr:Pyruvate/Phosphoenolpyruvate kinase-like domain-containing protein [Truncatella angustata]KAH6647176.1 Pyruvate/Phosphoenolpyruvate kinase-like domain-containing protein [Truncatella angustata]
MAPCSEPKSTQPSAQYSHMPRWFTISINRSRQVKLICFLLRLMNKPAMSSQISSPVVNASGKTRLRESLERAKRGEGPSVGQWLEFPGYTLARTIGSLGQDWVLIDCEHGNIDDNDMYLQVGAIASSGCSPIVRIPSSESWMMKRVLDAGAHAIMVPMCETKEQAEAIVRACKYPSNNWTQGIRGAGAMFASANFNQTGREYLLSANDNVMICVQIESRKAVENVEEIAKVDGIDMLFIGPNDLASSMGYVAFDHASIAEVQEASARILKASLDAGKYAGHFALSADIAATRYAQGFHFVNCGADIVAVTAWMSNEMASLKSLVQNLKKAGQARDGIDDRNDDEVRLADNYN